MNKHVWGWLCGALALITLPAAAAGPSVTGSWFRSLPGDLPAAGYFTLHNTTGKTLTLTGATSPGCASLELHMTHDMGGMMHMMSVPNVEIAAGATFAFAPGGYHLMCMGPKLKIGASVPVALKFADGENLTASFLVKNAKGD